MKTIYEEYNTPYAEHIKNLNSKNPDTRLESIRQLAGALKRREMPLPPRGEDVNNHIHTIYSFSPYSPAKAVWMAYMSGLATAGIMDHDTIRGSEEFRKAGNILGLPVTCGVECRVDFSKTPLNGRKLNNPDQDSIAYVAIHAVPPTQTRQVENFFRSYIMARNERNKKMVERINELFMPYDVKLNYEKDIVPLSCLNNGGTLTERHILFALSRALIQKFDKGGALIRFIEDNLGIKTSERIKEYLLDDENPYYEYDLMGVLKSDLVPEFYINAREECPDVREIIKLSRETGAISAYAYLGDVEDSVTGDKRPQKFEDSYLDELFAVLVELGFNAVTYMPSRNTLQQLMRVKTLCRQYGLMEISGEDINQPRQKFICDIMRNEEFANLRDTAWALIGNEIAASRDLSNAMFSSKTVKLYPDLEERIKVYSKIGKSC